MRLLLMGLGATAVLTSGCATGDARAGKSTIRDSAGITIVESSAPATPVYRTVDSTPLLDLGGEGDPHVEFNRVVGPVLLADGGVVVGDGGTVELRVFGPDGAWRRNIGRKGGGPGEFMVLSVLHLLPGDSMVVYDASARRISVFSPDGELAGLVTPTADGFPRMIERLTDGRMFMRVGALAPPTAAGSGLRRDSATIGVLAADGAAWDTLGRFPGNEAFFEVEGRGGEVVSVGVFTLPFARTLLTAGWAGHLVVAPSDDWQLGVYDTSGALVRVIRRTARSRTLTDADFERLVASQVGSFATLDQEGRDRYAQRLRDMPRAATMPALGAVLGADDGTLWVSAYRYAGDPEPPAWSVFDPEGRWLGDVAFPERFTLRSVRATIAAGVWRDEDDVEHVRLYRLR